MIRKSLLKSFLSVTAVSLLVGISTAEAKRRPQTVEEPLRKELNRVLDLSSQLHKALFAKDLGKVESSIGLLLGVIRRVEQQLVVASQGVGHLQQVLKNIHGSLQEIDEYPEEEKRRSLKSVFSNVVQIARNYRLNRYRLFFCAKDKSVWLQKGKKAHNPFSPDAYRNCGSLIR